MTYRQQVRQVIWSGGGESEKGLARYAELAGVGVGSCGTSDLRADRAFNHFLLSPGRYSLCPARVTGVEVRKHTIHIPICSMGYARTC